MLVKTTATKWEGLNDPPRITDTTNGDLFLFNGNRINGLQSTGASTSTFMFTDRLNDPKEKASFVTCTTSWSTIKLRMDKTWQSMLVQIPFYTDNDTAKATFVRHLNVETISYVMKDATAPDTRSWVIYYEGGKYMRLLAAYDIREIEALVDFGTITTSAG